MDTVHTRQVEKVALHDKDHAAAFSKHIITRMEHGSLNNMRTAAVPQPQPVEEHGWMKSFHFFKRKSFLIFKLIILECACTSTFTHNNCRL